MTTRVARWHVPVVKLIGRRLSAAETPEQVRRVIRVSSVALAPARGVTVERVTWHQLGGLRVSPKAGASPDRRVLLFHGGGYVFGSARMYRGLAGRIAKAASATVDVPDYRLAPEHPHPAAIEDGLAAYRAVIERVPVERVVVGGDSAGGGLTLAVLHAARADGLPMPAGAFLLSPWLDLRGRARDHANVTTELLIRPELVDRVTGWYLGGHDPAEPAVSPLLADHTGLPPTLVQVSRSELLYDQTAAFVGAARDAGVHVSSEVEDELWHVWQLMAPLLPEARASIASIGRFVVGCTG